VAIMQAGEPIPVITEGGPLEVSTNFPEIFVLVQQ
jgi:hypothetical protein